MSDKISFLYAQGMTTREVATALKEEISAALISRVADAAINKTIYLALDINLEGLKE